MRVFYQHGCFMDGLKDRFTADVGDYGWYETHPYEMWTHENIEQMFYLLYHVWDDLRGKCKGIDTVKVYLDDRWPPTP